MCIPKALYKKCTIRVTLKDGSQFAEQKLISEEETDHRREQKVNLPVEGPMPDFLETFGRKEVPMSDF